MPTLHLTEAEGRGAIVARMNASPVTPAKAKAVWHMLEKPSTRKVTDWFTAAGRPIHHKTIWKWERAGWPGTSAADIEQAAAAALVNIDSATAALSGDVPSTIAGVVEANAEAKAAQQTGEPLDSRGNAERAEEGLRAVVATAISVCMRIRDIAAAGPSGGAGANVDARPLPLLRAPGGVAKLTAAASAAANTAVVGFRQLVALRVEEAAAVPGSQTVYPPGEGPHPSLLDEHGLYRRREDDPLCAALDAFREEGRQIRAGKYAEAGEPAAVCSR